MYTNTAIVRSELEYRRNRVREGILGPRKGRGRYARGRLPAEERDDR